MDLNLLLPHKPPMILLSDVITESQTPDGITTKVTITEQDVFYDATLQGTASYIALEYMAQSIGVFAGLYDLSKVPPRQPSVGFILGTRKFKTYIPVFKVNETYFIRIKQELFDSEMVSFDCSIYDCADKLCTEAVINAYRPQDLKTFMKDYQ